MRARASIARFLRCEDGVFSAFGLFALMLMLMFGGFAIDLANHYSARTQLQVAADAAAHAALVTRARDSEAAAKAAALALHERNMPPGRYGQVLTADDIEFGTWNFANRTFTPQPGSIQAVRVTTRRIGGRANEVRTHLLGLVGVPAFDVERVTIFARFQPPCLREGFVAEQRVRIRSNNFFGEGFCLHSNEYVELNQNNIFEPGTVVSMPDLERLQLPASGFERNEGLEAALREGEMDIRILNMVDDIIEGVRRGDPDYLPGFLVNTAPVDRTVSNPSQGSLTQAQLEPGRLHRITCTHNNNTISLPGNATITDVVIWTNCDVSLGQNSNLQRVVLVTTSTASNSIGGAANAIFGTADNCGTGGAKILTRGGMRFAAKVTLHGSQLIARRDIAFSAQGAGIKGASLVAGGEIDGTSNMDMGLCGEGMDDGYFAAYFRMVL